MSQSTVLILRARGRLGSALAQAFAAQGWRVLSQARRASNGAPDDASGERITADLRDTEAIVRYATAATAATGNAPVAVVINAVNPIYTRWAEEAQPANDAAIAIARALGATLMFPGNVYNFGADMPEALRSDTPQVAATNKGRIRIAMECALADAASQGTQTIVIRAGDFFGCSSGSWFDQAIAKDVPRGKLTYPGAMDQAHAWAYVPDLAATFVRVAQARRTLRSFEQIHFVGHTVTGAELHEVVAHATAQPIKVAALPWPLIRLVGHVYPLWRELAEMAYLWQRSHRLVTDPVHAPLIAPATPFDEAIARSLVALHPQLALASIAASVATAR